jgi:hypothetical protein
MEISPNVPRANRGLLFMVAHLGTFDFDIIDCWNTAAGGDINESKK